MGERAPGVEPELKRISGFPPVIGARPRVLVLGSMPSERSLVQQEYYGHPQNAFWRIMGDLFAAGRDQSYADRLLHMQQRQIALWDVLESCERSGSLDANIAAPRANDFGALLASHATITHVFFNGRKAADEFRRKVRPQLEQLGVALDCRALPSTSPAHASLTYEQKLGEWAVIRDVLESKQGPGGE